MESETLTYTSTPQTRIDIPVGSEDPLQDPRCVLNALAYGIEVAPLLAALGVDDELMYLDILLSLWGRNVDGTYVEGAAVSLSRKRREFLDLALEDPERAYTILAAIASEDCNAVKEAVVIAAEALELEHEGMKLVTEAVNKGDCSKIKGIGVTLILTPARMV